jgi:hypothetical protein
VFSAMKSLRPASVSTQLDPRQLAHSRVRHDNA